MCPGNPSLVRFEGCGCGCDGPWPRLLLLAQVVCTHWACASRLGPLFGAVALPGFTVALERNLKWLDPRIYRVDIDHGWNRVAPTPLQGGGSHPLCPERVAVIPYPPHNGIHECRPRRQRARRRLEGAATRRSTGVFFAGTLREKLCGVTDEGREVHVEPRSGHTLQDLLPSVAAAAQPMPQPMRNQCFDFLLTRVRVATFFIFVPFVDLLPVTECGPPFRARGSSRGTPLGPPLAPLGKKSPLGMGPQCFQTPKASARASHGGATTFRYHLQNHPPDNQGYFSSQPCCVFSLSVRRPRPLQSRG